MFPGEKNKKLTDRQDRNVIVRVWWKSDRGFGSVMKGVTHISFLAQRLSNAILMSA